MLERKQIGALSKSIRLGRILHDEYSEIIDLYREGSSYEEIAKQIGVMEKYKVNIFVESGVESDTSVYQELKSRVVEEGAERKENGEKFINPCI